MLPPTRILVAVDFCEESAVALTYATRLSRLFGAELDVLHVVHPLLAATAAEHLTRLLTDTQASLRSFVATVPFLPGIVRVHVTTGLPGDAIMHVAERDSADLIVAGSRGMTLPERVVSGSTTERLLRLSNVPILLVPESIPSAIALSRMPVTRLVVGLECTAGAGEAARVASRLATVLGADLRFVHAVPEFAAAAMESDVATRAREDRCDSARRELTLLLDGIPHSGAPLDVRVGAVPRVLIEAIADEPDSLIILGRCAGAPGHPGAASVARRLVTLGAAPVLVHVAHTPGS